MNQVRTPADIAAFFKCTEEQARSHMRANAMQHKRAGDKAQSAKNGKYRGFTAAEWFSHAASIEAAANK